MTVPVESEAVLRRRETIEEIKRLKYRYVRCIDCKLWDELAECFAEDAVTSYASGQYSFQGRENILAFLKEALPPTMITMHQCFHPEIEITSETTAKGSWGFHDYLIELKENTSLRGYAYYEDEYVRVDGQWKIKATGYRRIFEETWNRAELPSLTLTENMFESSEGTSE